jgi:hypothetical protein
LGINPITPQYKYNYQEELIHPVLNILNSLQDESISENESILIPSNWRIEQRTKKSHAKGFAFYEKGSKRKYREYIGIESPPKPGLPNYSQIIKSGRKEPK